MFVLDNWGETKVNYLKYLAKFSIETNIEDLLHEMEGDDVSGKNEKYSQLAVELNSKLSMSKSLKIILSSIPSGSRNGLGFKTNIDFNHMFSVLSRRLANTKNEAEIISALNQMTAIEDTGASYIKDIFFTPTDNMMEIQLTGQFMQTFSKALTNYMITVTEEDGKVSYIDSRRQREEQLINTEWKGNSVLKYVKNGKYIGVTEGYELKEPIERKLEFLERLGITFSNKPQVISSRANDVHKAYDKIYRQVRKDNAPYIFSTTEDPLIGDQLANLRDVELSTGVKFVENSHLNQDGNRLYDMTLYSYTTLVLTELNKVGSLSEFYEKFPHLKGDPFFQNSLIIKNMFDNGERVSNYSVDYFIYEANREKTSKRAKGYSKFSPSERLISQWYQYNDPKSKYPIIRPGDNSLERYLSLGRFVVGGMIGEETIKQNTRNYLVDELNFIKGAKLESDNYANINTIYNVKRNESGDIDGFQPRGIILDEFSLVTADGTVLNNTDGNLTSNKILIDEFIETIDKDTDVEAWVEDVLMENYFEYTTMHESKIDNLIQAWLDNELIEKTKNGYKSLGVEITDADGNVLKSYTEATLRAELSDYIHNDSIANIEQYKLLYGHPKQYKALNDIFKRLTMSVGTKNVVFTDGIIDKYASTQLERIDGMHTDENSLTGGERVLKTATHDDIEVITEVENTYGDKVMEEGDGHMNSSLDAHREVFFRSGKWTNELEDLYQ